jgi:predicted metalloprotease with PDZ domain
MPLDPHVSTSRACSTATSRCSRRAWLAAAAASLVTPGVAADDEQPVIVNQPVAGAQIELQFTPGFSQAQRERARQWVVSGAEAVVGYFERFPVPQLELLLQGADGGGVVSGVTFGEPSLHMRVRLGRDTTAAQYRDDWVLVHEMVHLAVPRVPRPQRWLHEGIATYVESLARARAGLLDAAQVWRGWVRQMPRGQPEPGDRGLDHTPTWGRVYWGGAMFCLLADVRMRQRGHATRGLQQALQGVQRAGGDYRVAWSAPRILATADAAVGTTTLSDLYRDMKDSVSAVDLAALWRELGVEGEQLRDDAPLAAVRRAILA